MKSVTPEIEAPLVRVAEHQPEYEPVTTARTMYPGFPGALDVNGHKWNTVVMAFRPSEYERAQLAAGDDIYIGLLTFGRPQQPIVVIVGKAATAGVYRTKATDGPVTPRGATGEPITGDPACASPPSSSPPP